MPPAHLMSDNIKHITARIAAAAHREDWEFIEDVLRDEFARQRREAVEDHKRHLQDIERTERRYDPRRDVILETADGLRQKIAVPWEAHVSHLPILKRACRPFWTDASLSVGENMSALKDVPVRTYAYVGYDRDTGVPVYREVRE